MIARSHPIQIHETLLDTVMQKLETLTLLILNRLRCEAQLREQRKNEELEDRGPKDGAEQQTRKPDLGNEVSVVIRDKKLRLDRLRVDRTLVGRMPCG